MPKRLIYTIFLILFIINPSVVLAHSPSESTDSPTPKLTSTKNYEVDPEFKRLLEEKLQKAKDKQEAERKIHEQNKEIRKQKIEEFKIKAEKIKDARKKNAVLKINERIASISSQKTDKMADVLKRLNLIIEKLEDKGSLITGCDKTQLENSIIDAKSTIVKAEDLVTKQATKEYNIDLTDESTLKENVQTVIRSLNQDLQEVHKAVITAKEKVIKSAVELNKLKSCARISTTPQTENITPTSIITPTGI